MGDGAKLNNSIVLCTDSFTIKEVVLLASVLKIKYDLNFSIQGIKNNRPRIYILNDSKTKLINLVKPFIYESMAYKIS